MAGLSANDTRAQDNGPVAWADDGAHARVRWDEKYIASDEGHLGPTAWTESKHGMTSDIRDKLLAEKEGKRPVSPGGSRQNAPSPFINHEPRLSERPSLEHRRMRPAPQPAPSKLSAPVNAVNAGSVYAGTQQGYGRPRDVKEAYWDFTLKQPIAAVQAPASKPSIFKQSAPPQEADRLARAEELHAKLGIDKVNLRRGFVDSTPQAGHHTAAVEDSKRIF